MFALPEFPIPSGPTAARDRGSVSCDEAARGKEMCVDVALALPLLEHDLEVAVWSPCWEEDEDRAEQDGVVSACDAARLEPILLKYH